MAQETFVVRKGGDADLADITATTLTTTGAATVGGALTASAGLAVSAVSGVTTAGPLVKLTETVAFDDFTDGGAAVGTFTLTVGQIPVGAYFLGASVTAVTGFTGDTSAVLTIGDGTDVDRYNTGTVNVFATAAGGVAAGIPSGVRYHDTAKSVVLTVTSGADFTSVAAGSVTVELFYLT